MLQRDDLFAVLLLVSAKVDRALRYWRGKDVARGRSQIYYMYTVAMVVAQQRERELDLLAGLFFGRYIQYPGGTRTVTAHGVHQRHHCARPRKALGSPRNISQGSGLAFHWAPEWEKTWVILLLQPANVKI
jgi:hypothetical protein